MCSICKQEMVYVLSTWSQYQQRRTQSWANKTNIGGWGRCFDPADTTCYDNLKHFRSLFLFYLHFRLLIKRIVLKIWNVFLTFCATGPKVRPAIVQLTFLSVKMNSMYCLKMNSMYNVLAILINAMTLDMACLLFLAWLKMWFILSS